MGEKIILTTFSRTELMTLIIDCMNKCLKVEREKDILLTKQEAAKLLKVSVSTIENLMRAGVLEKYYVGRAVRFKRQNVLSVPELLEKSKKAIKFKEPSIAIKGGLKEDHVTHKVK